MCGRPRRKRGRDLFHRIFCRGPQPGKPLERHVSSVLPRPICPSHLDPAARRYPRWDPFSMLPGGRAVSIEYPSHAPVASSEIPSPAPQSRHRSRSPRCIPPPACPRKMEAQLRSSEQYMEHRIGFHLFFAVATMGAPRQDSAASNAGPSRWTGFPPKREEASVARLPARPRPRWRLRGHVPAIPLSRAGGLPWRRRRPTSGHRRLEQTPRIVAPRLPRLLAMHGGVLRPPVSRRRDRRQGARPAGGEEDPGDCLVAPPLSLASPGIFRLPSSRFAGTSPLRPGRSGKKNERPDTREESEPGGNSPGVPDLWHDFSR